MKRSSHLLTLAVLFGVGVLVAQSASAQALIDSAVSGMIGGDTELNNAAKAPPPPSAILNGLQRQGFTNISDLAPTPIGTPMRATAISPAGTPVDLLIDPKTGKLVSATPR